MKIGLPKMIEHKNELHEYIEIYGMQQCIFFSGQK